MEHTPFTTSYGRTIAAHRMRVVTDRLYSGEDWQSVGTEELRDMIPEHPEDLSELNEILSEAEERFPEE